MRRWASCRDLAGIGDRVGLYAYNSQGASTVNIVRSGIRRSIQRGPASLHSLKRGLLTVGAAIRTAHPCGNTRRNIARLLVVLSDGLAYDHGYDRDYGAADARRALAEARYTGTGALCLTFGSTADAASLRRVFGSASHASVSTQSQMAHAVGVLAHAALRSADMRRRVA